MPQLGGDRLFPVCLKFVSPYVIAWAEQLPERHRGDAGDSLRTTIKSEHVLGIMGCSVNNFAGRFELVSRARLNGQLPD